MRVASRKRSFMMFFAFLAVFAVPGVFLTVSCTRAAGGAGGKKTEPPDKAWRKDGKQQQKTAGRAGGTCRKRNASSSSTIWPAALKQTEKRSFTTRRTIRLNTRR